MSTPSTTTRSGYAVGSPTRVCAATGRTLETGEPYVAALVQTPDAEEYRRVDVALDAWMSGARPRTEDGRRLAVLGSWRAIMPEPGAKKRLLIDDESLLDMFEQSGEEAPPGGEDDSVGSDDVGRGVFRFMLALILLRKKLLVCERTERGGSMFVRPRGSLKASEGGVLFEVHDPGLSEESIARVVEHLSALLDGEAAAGVGSPPASQAAGQGGGT